MLHREFGTRLWQESAAFAKSAYLPDQFEPGDLLDSLLGVFSAFSNSAELPSLRIYVDNGQRFDLFNAAHRVARNEPLTRHNAERCLAKALGTEQFCITLNGLTKWSAVIDRFAFANLIGPFLKESGWRGRGVDTYSFIGNYGFTPFGIHDDNDHSLLLQLGPSPKHVWIIPRSKYLEHHGDQTSSFDYANYERLAERYVLNPGDAVFIPMGDFHVFRSDNFSVTLGVTFFPFDPANHARDLLEEVLQHEHLPMHDVSEIVSALPSAGRRIQVRRDSNCQLTTLPRLRNLVVRDEDLLVRPAHHRLLLLEEANKLMIFARGRSFSVRSNEPVRRLLEQINTTVAMSIRDLYESQMGVSVDAIRSIVQVLVRWSFLDAHSGSPESP